MWVNRLTITGIMATSMSASLVSVRASSSLCKRRYVPSQATVRSTTQRLGNTWKCDTPVGRLLLSSVQSHQRAAPIPPLGRHRPHRPTSPARATASRGRYPPPTVPHPGLVYRRHEPPPSPPNPRYSPADGVCARGRFCQHHPLEFPVFRRCDRLAVENRSTRFCRSPCGTSYVRAKSIMDAHPSSIPLPAPNGMIHGLPGRHVIRKHPPGAPTAQDREDSVQNLPVRMDAVLPSG
jgi:hypothetical protein